MLSVAKNVKNWNKLASLAEKYSQNKNCKLKKKHLKITKLLNKGSFELKCQRVRWALKFTLKKTCLLS